MKKIITFCVAICATITIFAQQQLATLNHNGTISVYYGHNALLSAHSAAVNGDIITLSPGIFDEGGGANITITKAITIRGAGMWRDTLGNEPTKIRGDVYLDILEDSNYRFEIEGIYFENAVRWRKVYRPKFVKCYFSWTFQNQTNSSAMYDAQFVNCILTTTFTNSRQNNTQFYNCVIEQITGNAGNISLINCIAGIDNQYLCSQNCYVLNSILFQSVGTLYQYNGITSYYSIGINTSNSNSNPYFDIVNTPNHSLHNYSGFQSVFQTFNDQYYEGMTFELQDSIATSLLGDDSTQIGIYGGLFPFNPNVRNPRIRRCNVASRSTADNKLSVDIEVVSE